MRYLRLSFFPAMKAPPMTTIVDEDSLRVSIEDAERIQREDAIKAGGFVVSEIFEDEGELPIVTANAVQRIDQQVERNMGVLFFWTLMHMPQVRQGGSILPNPAAPNYPAPLTGEQAETTLNAIALSPECKPSVTVEVHCEDGTKLRLLNGRVTRL